MSALLTFAGFLPALALPQLMQAVDRGWGKTGGKTRAKLLALVAIAVGFLAIWGASGPLIGGWPGAAIVLTVVIGRSMGFAKNAATVVDGASLRKAWTRAIVPVALAIGVSAFAYRWNLVPTIAAAVIFGWLATRVVSHAKDYGDYLQAMIAQGLAIGPDDPFNAQLERKRGFEAGVALLLWLAIVAGLRWV